MHRPWTGRDRSKERVGDGMGDQPMNHGPGVQRFAVFLLVPPWVWPFADGPTPGVLPWLVSLSCFCLLVLARSWRHFDLARALAIAVLIAALASSVMALIQYFGFSALASPWVNITDKGSAFGNLRQRNQFATLMNMGLVVLLWGPASQGAGRGRRTSAFWAIALSAGNAASLSRTGLLQMLMLIPLLALWSDAQSRRAWNTLAAALAGYAVAVVALPLLAGLDPFADGLASRFEVGNRPCGSRLVLWGNVLQLIALKPFGGWGVGELDYAHFMTPYPGERFCEILDNAHNLPLHLAVELGVPFAVLVCSVALWLVWRGRPWRETGSDRRMAWATISVIMLHSMLEYPLWYGPFQIATCLCIWILARGSSAPLAGASTVVSMSGSSVTRLPAVVFSMLCLEAAGYAAWDYRRISQIYLPASARAETYREHTLAKLQSSWLFRNQVRFAEFTMTELQPGNADHLNAMAHELLHFSPEARVVEKLVESAVMLGRDDQALAYMARYRAAFPKEYAAWASSNRMAAGIAPAAK